MGHGLVVWDGSWASNVEQLAVHGWGSNFFPLDVILSNTQPSTIHTSTI